MSRLPKIDKKPKNNRSTKFRWVDSQWEKFIDKQKLDAEYIENLECVISEMTDRLKDLGDESWLKSNGMISSKNSNQTEIDFEVTDDKGNGDFKIDK